MADGITFEIKGMAELAKTLEQDLPEAMAKRAIKDALRAGGEVIANAAEANAKGELAESMTVVVRISNRSSLSGIAMVGPAYDRSQLVTRKRGLYAGRPDPTSSPGVFGLFVEKGHGAPGTHRSRQNKSAREMELGGHGTPPHPFLGPAFDSAKDDALQAIIDTLREGIDEAVKEVAKR